MEMYFLTKTAADKEKAESYPREKVVLKLIVGMNISERLGGIFTNVIYKREWSPRKGSML